MLGRSCNERIVSDDIDVEQRGVEAEQLFASGQGDDDVGATLGENRGVLSKRLMISEAETARAVACEAVVRRRALWVWRIEVDEIIGSDSARTVAEVSDGEVGMTESPGGRYKRGK